jgi:energy-coupling factor transporter ATP-binding protein EcfA2
VIGDRQKGNKLHRRCKEMKGDSDWDSAGGWDGSSEESSEERKRTEKEQRAEQKRYFKAYRERTAGREAIEVRAVGDWLREQDEDDEPLRAEFSKTELFAPFWSSGELAVLMGPSGSGKSRLAMQIAAAAAAAGSRRCDSRDAINFEDADERTTPSADEKHRHPPLLRKEGSQDVDFAGLNEGSSGVLYLDLERTRRQYQERYSDPNNPTGMARSPTGVELGLLANVPTPESYRGHRHNFLLSAIGEQLNETDCPVVIIDNLTWLIKGQPGEIGLLMRSFRRWVNQTGSSLLLLWHSSSFRSHGSQAVKFELADSVFMIERSTMGEDIRYLRSLWSGTEASAGSFDPRREVMVLKQGEVRPGLDGFTAIGVSHEIDHYRDYASEMEAAEHVAAGAQGLLTPPKLDAPKRVKFLGISD